MHATWNCLREPYLHVVFSKLHDTATSKADHAALPPEISSPPSLDAASSLELMGSQEATELMSVTTGAVSSAREAQMSSSSPAGETGTTACPTLSLSKTLRARASPNKTATVIEPTEDNMVRGGDQTVAVGDWGYPGYLTKQEWDVFVSYYLVTNVRIGSLFPPVGPTFYFLVALKLPLLT